VSALVLGVGLGLFVGAQPGPVSLLCIRSVVRGPLVTGIAIGAGAAVIDALYAVLGVAGAAALLEIDALRIGLGMAGAVLLAVIGGRTLWAAFRVRLGGEADGEVATPRRAFATALAATASNPLTIASWAAIFAAASTAEIGDVTASAAGAVALIAGIAVGTLTAFTVLSCVVALLRERLGPGLVTVADLVAGTGLLGFAGLLGWRTAHDR
jgi:putative LysE/RhtB family amino acid efflux pump